MKDQKDQQCSIIFTAFFYHIYQGANNSDLDSI